MKQKDSIEIQALLAKCRKIPVNRNDRFWMDAIEFLGSISKSKEYPDFLISWAKEVVNILKAPGINIFLVMPLDGCWGIYIEGKDNYMFSYNDGHNIYISYRLYKDLKEKNAYNLLAGLLLHEVSEFIMRLRTEKKGGKVDVTKNHGEAMRLERVLLGKGKEGETLLSDLFFNLIDLEQDRRKVALDKQDIFVEGCAISGEEIVTEISSVRQTGESFILQLAPGQKKSLPYSGGNFTAQAGQFSDPFRLDAIDFKDYCNLMKIMDDFFIEESVINGEGPFKEFLSYVRNLDFSNGHDNLLLRILWLFTQRFYNNDIPRGEFLYNMFLLADEYLSYFIMKDVVKKYWQEGRLAKDNVEEILEDVYKRKPAISPRGLKSSIIGWFSKMDSPPGFSKIESLKWVSEIPNSITKFYKKITTASVISGYEKDIYAELSLHEEILGIIQAIRLLMNEARQYKGIKQGEDSRVYELNMVRVHFWKGKNIFNRGETVGLYSHGNKGFGFAEVIDVKEHSIVIFLEDVDVIIPEAGYIKKLEEEDLSISVSLEAINKVKSGKDIKLWIQ